MIKKPRLNLIFFGAYGDALMLTPLLPQLAQQYEVHLLGTPKTEEVLRNNPHIHELTEMPYDDAGLFRYWDLVSGMEGVTVNLSDVIVGQVLRDRRRADHNWPRSQRENVSMPFVHALTETLYRALLGHRIEPEAYLSEVEFYPLPEERYVAEAWRKENGKFIYFQLTGSSHHKDWPYSLTAAKALHLHTGLKVLFGCGRKGERETLIHRATKDFCNDHPWAQLDAGNIRTSMTLAAHADLVIGPETGIMWSVASSYVPKVMLLSHSGAKLYQPSFINTRFLSAGAACQPCYRTHPDEKFCPQYDHAALCMKDLGLKTVCDAALEMLQSFPRP